MVSISLSLNVLNIQDWLSDISLLVDVLAVPGHQQAMLYHSIRPITSHKIILPFGVKAELRTLLQNYVYRLYDLCI